MGDRLKHCRRCESEKSQNQFSKNKNQKDGLSSWCKSCYKEYYTQYLAKNRNKNKEKCLKWHRANRTYAVKRMQVYYSNNRERNSELCREWREKNSERACFFSAKHRTAKLNQTVPLNNAQQVEIEYMYLYNKIMPGNWDVDHIIPLQGESVRGLHVPWNLQVISAADNRRKKNKVLL